MDNDGDVDVLVGNDAGAVRLLINNIGNRQHWVGLRLAGAPTGRCQVGQVGQAAARNRDMLGARVGVTRAGATIWRRVHSDGSYASSSDPRVLVGLGASPERPIVQVQWPDGRTEQWRDVAIDSWTTLVQGSGR